MQVALGTVTVEADTLKAINKEQGKPGRAKRDEAKAYLLAAVEKAIAEAGPKPDPTPITSPQPEGTLPEPPTDASTV